MDLEELKAMIPSKSVRQYVLDTGLTFTDMKKAAMIYHNRDLLLEQKNAWLRTLRDRTEDEVLREQITENLNWDEQAIRAFKSKPDIRCFYMLNVREDHHGQVGDYVSSGYFTDWETAYAFGCKKKAVFELEKYLVDDKDRFGDGTCSYFYAGDIQFNEDGEIICAFSREIPDIEFDTKRFTDMYYDVPNPFEYGDIVEHIKGGYGIMATSQERWKKRRENVKDFTDVIISVDFFDEESGTFDYGGDITPLDLEFYHPKETGNDLSSLRDKILMSRSRADRGQGSLDELYQLTMEYRRLHEQTDQNAREKKAILKALGKGRWMTVDELEELAKDDCDCGQYTVCVHMNRFRGWGYVQSVYPPGTDDVLYCGLITPPQE